MSASEKSPTIDPELITRFNTLWKPVYPQRKQPHLDALEKKLNKNSTNSSKPPSPDDPYIENQDYCSSFLRIPSTAPRNGHLVAE